MRIIESSQNGNAAPARMDRAGQAAPVQTNRGASKAGKASSDSDSVELSGFSGQLASTLKTAAANRADRVNRIAEAINSGTYKVDTQALSRALVDDALANGGSQ